jgi:hypothetical protein
MGDMFWVPSSNIYSLCFYLVNVNVDVVGKNMNREGRIPSRHGKKQYFGDIFVTVT